MRWLAATLAALALGGCGGDGDGTFAGAPAEDPGPVHVHGLGVDRAGTLFVATHTGLWKLPPDAQRAVRVGDRRQDVMGFTVAGPGRFLGSGHPDVRDDLPPLLGLIASTDAGRTWKSVSLLGETDFHVLRAAGDAVWGWDATSGLLYRSRDGGRSWTTHDPPEALVDLALDPRDPERAVAAGSVLYRTRDGGRTWSVLGGEPGYLAWPEGATLLELAADGTVLRSDDGGERWERVGSIDGEPAAFLAVSARELYAALHDGTILRSRDGARSWTVRSRP